ITKKIRAWMTQGPGAFMNSRQPSASQLRAWPGATSPGAGGGGLGGRGPGLIVGGVRLVRRGAWVGASVGEGRHAGAAQAQDGAVFVGVLDQHHLAGARRVEVGGARQPEAQRGGAQYCRPGRALGGGERAL